MKVKEFYKFYSSVLFLVFIITSTLLSISDKVILLNESICLYNLELPIPFNLFILISQVMILLFLCAILFLLSEVEIDQVNDNKILLRIITAATGKNNSSGYVFIGQFLAWGILFLVFIWISFYAVKMHSGVFAIFHYIILALFFFSIIRYLNWAGMLTRWTVAGTIGFYVLYFSVFLAGSYGRVDVFNLVVIGDMSLVTENMDSKSVFYKDFSDRSFEYAILSGNAFVNCNFQGANMKGADLSGSVFWDSLQLTNSSSFADAVLMGTDLSYAELINCNLSRADLNGCDLFEAEIDLVDFADCYLNLAKGLQTEQFMSVSLFKAAQLPQCVKDSVEANSDKYGYILSDIDSLKKEKQIRRLEF